VDLLIAALLCAAQLGAAEVPPGVHFQAHRGGLEEVPENTLAAYEYAWSIPGAVPEMDLATTVDGVVVCLHDDTPKRTTDAPGPWCDKNLREIPFKELRTWDAGVKFDPKYAGARIPTLDEVLALMKAHPERQAYFDLKDVELDVLVQRIKTAGVQGQVIFVHGDPGMCLRLSGLYAGARTMTWLSGSPDDIKSRFAELAKAGFRGISQLQLHLNVRPGATRIEYLLEPEFLARAARTTRAAGVALQLRPFAFDPPSLRKLIDVGVRWYVTDAPRAFADCVARARVLPGK